MQYQIRFEDEEVSKCRVAVFFMRESFRVFEFKHSNSFLIKTDFKILVRLRSKCLNLIKYSYDILCNFFSAFFLSFLCIEI